jgi:hypothetical protein
LLRRAVPENAPLINDVGAIGDRKRLAYIMVRNQDSNAAGLEVKNDFLQVEYRNGIDSLKRLVQQNEYRLDAEAAGNLDSAALAP